MTYYYDDINDKFEQKFEWEVAYTLVTEESIIRLRKDRKFIPHPDFRKYYKPFRYNVFEVKDIYEEFSNIDTDNLKSIDNFVNKRGILGLHIENYEENLLDKINEYEAIEKRAIEENNFEIMKLHYKERKLYNLLTEEYTYRESISAFTKEVKLMKAILTLNSFEKIKVSELETVKSLMNEIIELTYVDFNMNFPKQVKNTTADFILLQHEARALISGVIALKMKNVKPKLGLTFKKSEGYTYIDTWQPKSLLGCMYTMLYYDLSQGNKTAICKACGKPVVIRGKRSKPYHKDCQTRKHTANSRKKRAILISKYIQDKYLNSNIPTEEILERERNNVVVKFGRTSLDVFNRKRINEWLNRK